ncbi:metallophosphoesterase [Reichenbachiella carrageenanivorans]|uniref:Metallophosphoesterase n=1 Tax=Reichenbachiella carrageenanivorans TaxID=2979869 RepID=A0ABY6D339_9BACT|nr:BamA/TamA family outer membrane protein [Reichenbachiella carrageenanivorans]UXX80572.1 metallophosphoesterase [Reichenbachiella carrageenanivorans]
MIRSTLLFIVLGFSIIGWAQSPSTQHQVFLIGDAGEPKRATENLSSLKEQLQSAGKNATLIFLGDNIYPKGLPPKEHPGRKEAEEKLKLQLDITKKFEGRTIVIPGNHDWEKGRKEGWKYVNEQERFVKEYFDSKKVFYPKDGHPGPEEIKLAEGLYLIVFDMQWILHAWEKPLEHDPLEKMLPLDVIMDITSLLEEHKNDHVILASHHPLYSYGAHGGKFPLKTHLFPLTELNENLYVPLPVVGSIYPAYRATAGSIQDIPHPEYKTIRNTLEHFLKQYPNVVYVAGHEHSLQHIQKDGVNYVVSGSGSKATYLKENGEYLAFGKSIVGFGKLNFDQADVSVEFWAADDQSTKGKKIYEGGLYQFKYIPDPNANYPRYDFHTQLMTTAASEQYEASKGKRVWMGDNYRAEWSQPVTVPIFNITEEKGGLEVVKRGGGMQTNSLRLEAKDGRQYVLRSVEKYANKAVPDLLQETFAVKVVQDQISSSHPYGAFVVPPLAEAVGIYHTNPRLVYVPDDGAFGTYREVLAGELALFEERPSGDWSDAKFFGNSTDIVGSPEVQEELQDDNDNSVDQNFVLRNRLFDMVIGDWDRHEDQWRWASFEKGKGNLYRPIPRDRDQVFFINDGILPKIASRKWAMPKIEGFNENMRWAPGFNFNARYFDRIFMNEPDRDEWQQMIQLIQDSLTDEVIENAIRKWPENVYALSGERTVATLKARRDHLDEYATAFYESLSKQVNVVGTDKKELFLIENLNKDQLRVTSHKISKKGHIEQPLYHRTFDAADTKEVRIYGLDDEDRFKISGDTKSKVKVRVIGGEGDDEIFDMTSNQSAQNVKVYDLKKETLFSTVDTSFKPRLSRDPDINNYNKYEFKYDLLLPLVVGSYNRDDGVFVGGGFMYTRHGWRKEPFASRHRLMADVAIATGAFNVAYKGDFTDVFGKWNLNAVVDVKRPVVNNFFGLGNESVYDEDRGIDYYRLRVEDYYYALSLYNEIGNSGKISLGLHQRSIEVENNSGTFISSPGFNEFNTDVLFDDRRHYGGGFASLEFDTRDEKLFPSRGLYWESEWSSYYGLSDRATNYKHLHSSLSLYYSFQFPAIVTLASRTGYAHNFGEFSRDEFYNANTLGGRSNLRGYRKTRFYGRTSFYQNVDLRLKLLDFSSVLFPGKLGLLGFYDIGRVWTDQSSSAWHRAAGVGLWVAPLSKVAASLSYAFSPEENLISLDFGFFF